MMESLLDIFKFAFAFFFGRRVHLVTFYGSGGSQEIPDLPGSAGAIPPGTLINAHSVVLQNIGRASAHNVRVGHHTLAGVSYRVTNAVPTVVPAPAPSTEVELVIPVIPPGYQVAINYLYFPPLTYANIQSYIISDEGMADGRNLLQAWRMSNSMKLALTIIVLGSVLALALALYLFVPWFANWIASLLAKL